MSFTHAIKDYVVLALKDSGTSMITQISDEWKQVNQFVEIGYEHDKPKAALEYYDGLPRELRINRYVLMWRVFFAKEVAPREFVKAVAEMRRGIDDPRVEVLYYRAFRMTREHQRAVDSLARLDEFVGGDAYLKYLQARLYPRLEDEERAQELLRESHELEPELREPLELLLYYALRAKQHKDTLSWVKKLQRLGTRLDFQQPRFASFVQSSVYKKWRESQRGADQPAD